MTRHNEERKLEGILLVITQIDDVKNINNLVRLDFKDGSVFYQTSPLNPVITQEDLNSRLGKDYVDKMIKVGMDNAGSSYLVRRELPRRVEVWPMTVVRCLELRAYYTESKEPEVWSIDPNLI